MTGREASNQQLETPDVQSRLIACSSAGDPQRARRAFKVKVHFTACFWQKLGGLRTPFGVFPSTMGIHYS